jgi:hypothetical protein
LPACLASRSIRLLVHPIPAVTVSGPENQHVWVSEASHLSVYLSSLLTKATAQCSFTVLQNFISSAMAIQTTDQRKLMAASQNATSVFTDSYIVLQCASGYMNTGGSLNVTCLSSGSWTPFPNCVLTGGGPVTSTGTTMVPSNGVGCPIDAATTYTIANGYFVNSTLAYTSATTAIGTSRNEMNCLNVFLFERIGTICLHDWLHARLDHRCSVYM